MGCARCGVSIPRHTVGPVVIGWCADCYAAVYGSVREAQEQLIAGLARAERGHRRTS